MTYAFKASEKKVYFLLCLAPERSLPPNAWWGFDLVLCQFLILIYTNHCRNYPREPTLVYRGSCASHKIRLKLPY